MEKKSIFIKKLINTMLGAVIILTPAIVNNSPFLFFDSSQYLQFGKAISSRIPVIKTVVNNNNSDNMTSPSKSVNYIAKNQKDEDRDHPSLSYAGGRAYYSMFSYLTVRMIGLWGVAVIQALVASWVIVTAFYAACSHALYWMPSFFLALLTASTSLAFFTDMVMPDIFAGIALLSIGTLALGFDRLTQPTRFSLVVISAASISTHVTIGPLCVVEIATIIFTPILITGRPIKRFYSVISWSITPLVLAGVAFFAFNLTTRLLMGETPRSPPYLMARVLADGPGRSYLENDACNPLPKYSLCQFVNYSFDTQDSFLWNGVPGIGVFSTTNYRTRIKLEDEELRFVVGVISRYPLQQLRASTKNWLGALSSFTVGDDFSLAKQSWDTMSFMDTIPDAEAGYKAGMAYRGKFPFQVFDVIQITVIIVSILRLIYCAGPLVTPLMRSRSLPATQSCAVLWMTAYIACLSTIIANAAMCGILSGVHDRYQVRVIWLVPALALLTFFADQSGAKRAPPRRATAA